MGGSIIPRAPSGLLAEGLKKALRMRRRALKNEERTKRSATLGAVAHQLVFVGIGEAAALASNFLPGRSFSNAKIATAKGTATTEGTFGALQFHVLSLRQLRHAESPKLVRDRYSSSNRTLSTSSQLSY